jgi:aryl hydrocarbon receptor nuclear translocator
MPVHIHLHPGKVHCCTSFVSLPGAQLDGATGNEDGSSHVTSQCLVAIGRLQVTSSPNSSDLLGATNACPTEFISRHSIDGKFTFVDQRFVWLAFVSQELQEVQISKLISWYRNRN